MIDGTCTRQTKLLNSICMNLFPTKCLSKKKDFRRIPNLEVYLNMFNMSLKYPRISEKLLPTFHPSLQEQYCWQRRRWSVYQRKSSDLTYENANFKLFLGEWNNLFTVAATLSGLRTGLQKLSWLCAIHSTEMLQKNCSICEEF